jgi:transposase
MVDTPGQALQVQTPKKRRRTVQERREIVEETLSPGASVSRVARRHDVNANQLFYWRKLYREGRLGSGAARPLLPVKIAEGQPAEAAKWDRPALGSGTMEIQVSKGTIRIAGSIDVAAYGAGVFGAMIGLPVGTRIWIAAGVTDLRRGFTGLSGMVQTVLQESPFSGHVFLFRGRRGDLIKMLWFDGDGLCLFAKRLERGRFLWPQATSGTVSLTPAQLSMLLEGIDWRHPVRSYDPQMAV